MVGLRSEKASVQRDWQPSHIPGESAHTILPPIIPPRPAPTSLPFIQMTLRVFKEYLEDQDAGQGPAGRSLKHGEQTGLNQLPKLLACYGDTPSPERQLETPCTAEDGPLMHASPHTHMTAVCPLLVHRPHKSRGGEGQAASP